MALRFTRTGSPRRREAEGPLPSGAALGRRPASPWRYPAAAGIVAVTTLVAHGLVRLFDTTRLSMVFLAAVLVSAVSLGAGPAYFAAFLAFVVYNIYLVEPRFIFRFASAEDVLVLLVFLAVAVLTGGLAGRLHDEARRNRLWAQAAGALFEASRRMSSAGDEELIRRLVVEHVARAARGHALIVDAGRVWACPEPAPDGAAEASPDRLRALGWQVRPIRAEDVDLGALAWRSEPGERPDIERERLIAILADLAAAAVSRARLSAAQSEMAALARTEQLRTALLSSISHDLRTPLAAILASASSLKAYGDRFSPEVRDDLIETIEEEAERLNRFVGNLLSMTKLESGALFLDAQAFNVLEVLERLAARLQRVHPALVRDYPAGVLLADGDPLLLEQALGNVLDNAAVYGLAGAEIVLRCRGDPDRVVIEVENHGPDVPPEERARIFDKFHRCGATTGGRQGAGLGLSITRGLMEAMGGSATAAPRADGRAGLTVALALPRAPG